jgi:LysM repeat protein
MTSDQNHTTKQISSFSSVAEEAKQPLPSRSEVQRNRRSKNKKRRKKVPLITWLAVFFIFMPVVIFLLVSNIEKIKLPLLTDSASGYETVEFSKKEPENNSNSTPANTQETEEENQEPLEEAVPVYKENQDLIENSDEPKVETETPEIVAESDESSDLVVLHTVQIGDTIYSISMEYYQAKDGMDLIRQENSLNGDEIQVGQVLKIPLEK